jgi:uncharacterized protein
VVYLQSPDIIQRISEELNLDRKNVERTVSLLDQGNTVPFIARYRKEATGGLDEVSIRQIGERIGYLRALEDRKREVISLISGMGKITPELEATILQATKIQQVEDLYRPFRPKKRTRATVAREKGLESLAEQMLEGSVFEGSPEEYVACYVDKEKGVDSIEDALAGAKDIIAEMISDDAGIREIVRNAFLEEGFIKSEYIPADERETTLRKTEYMMYYAYEQRISRIPPHRILAINRGEREGILKVRLIAADAVIVAIIKKKVIKDLRSIFASLVAEAVEDTYARLIVPSIEREIRNTLSEKAEAHSIVIFATNLRNLLLQSPIRGKVVMGIDPAYRTGCKVAVVNESGDVLGTTTVYPHEPQKRMSEAKKVIGQMLEEFKVEVISIGNGTASRETCEMVADIIEDGFDNIHFALVDEAGASVYSASEIAREELLNMDVSMRGAVSIARRLQDPLAELVKIDPKSIGVGLYQHDVSQKRLSESLNSVVESCVNFVGVDLNSASAALLQYVAGLSSALAKRIVEHRKEHGVFRSREELKRVHGLGEKTFIQCAGFLKIPESDNPLDNTWVHPESYEAVEKLVSQLGFSLGDLVDAFSRSMVVESLENHDLDELVSMSGLGVSTMKDIIDALRKPGRDPRDEMPQPQLEKDVLRFEDLRIGMILEGTVRNVVDFGAFIDIGLKRDGLVHITQMSDKYVSHPTDIVSVGDIVKVKVIQLDPDRERVSLSMKFGGITTL